MFEGDDDDSLRRKLERARRDPTISPHLKFQLEKQVKQEEKQKLAKLRKEMARKELKEKQEKLRKEMDAKGIQHGDTKPKAEQLIDKAKRQEAANRAQGQTEKPAQTV